MKNYVKPTCEMVRYKPIDGYENYFVTETGLVWSAKRMIFLRPELGRDKRLRVTLSKNGKSKHKFVHILVAEAFVPKPRSMEPLDAHHIDSNPINNCASNLSWVTRAEHQIIHGKRPIMCLENGKTYVSQGEAARELNLHVGNINACLHGGQKQTHGYHSYDEYLAVINGGN